MDPASERLVGTQTISNVSATHSQVVVGSVGGDVVFAASDNTDSKDKKVQRYCDAVFLTDPAVDRAHIISAKGKRVPGTCEWIRENECYRAYLEGDVQLLSISGGPGKGKTMLAVFLSEELERQRADERIIFYFCSSDDHRRNNVSSILRGLVFQLIRKLSTFVHLPELESDTMIKASINDRESLWNIFVKLCKEYKDLTLFCIIDGLDECDADSSLWLIKRLAHLLVSEDEQRPSLSLRMAIVSRRIIGLEKIQSRVHLDPDHDQPINLDIQRFVAKRVQELVARFPDSDPQFQQDIRRILEERADGTFLWVGFAMDEMLKKKTLHDVRKTIDEMPSGLPAIYARMLLQIEPAYRQITSYILKWVTLSKRPLLLTELMVAVACETQTLPEQTLSGYLVHCGSFVRVHERDLVSLIHQSARDYLLRKEPDAHPDLENFRIQPEKAHSMIARKCLDFVIEHEAMVHSADWRTTTFMLYALLQWPQHAKLAMGEAEGVFSRLSEGNFSLYLAWRQKLMRFGLTHVYGETHPNPLHFASSRGIVSWVAKLLRVNRYKLDWWRMCRWINQPDKTTGETALHYAVIGEHEDVVSLLLQYKANVSIKDKQGLTALHHAAENPSHAIFRKLFEAKSFPVGLRAGTKDGLLSPAAAGGNEENIRLLIQHKADVNYHDEWLGSPLGAASRGGSLKVVKLLLDAGANVNACGGRYCTALQAASRWGHWDIVQLLLDKGAEVDIRGGAYGNALQAALVGVNQGIVQLLLSRGARISFQGVGFESAVHFVPGYGKMIELLLKASAGLQIRGVHSSELRGVLDEDRKVVIELLRGAGEDLSKYALETASQRGFQEARKLLQSEVVEREVLGNLLRRIPRGMV